MIRLPSLKRIDGRPLRIAYGRVFQETNAFSPLPTTRSDFEAMHCLDADALERETRLTGHELRGYLRHAELTGFRQAARLAGNVECVPLWSTLAVSGGPVCGETFAWLIDETMRRLDEAGDVDGIYLAMHGSMQVDTLDTSPEGEILRRLRERIGNRRLAVSYDLHGNLAQSMLEADVVVAYHTNPHRDLFGTGFRAGRRLIESLRGHSEPVHSWRKLPMVLGGGLTIDFLQPMRRVFQRIKEMERRPGVLSANLFMVHPYSKLESVGWAAHVTSDGDPELADRTAEELADLAWAQRNVPLPEIFHAQRVLDEVRTSPWRRIGAVSLVDVDDIVGAGAPGGNTHLIRELVKDDRGLRSYVPLHDPAAVERLWPSARGTALSFALQGTPGYGQPEVALDAVVAAKCQTDFGRTIRLDAGNLHVAVTERPPYTCSPRFWKQLGLSARRADVIVQKAFFHYRMFYAASSFRHIGFTSSGASSLDRVRDRNYLVPTWPGQSPNGWRSYDRILRGCTDKPHEADRLAGLERHELSSIGAAVTARP